MQVQDVELAAPTGTQVVVKIGAAGVNPVDTYLRTGNHAHAPKLPYTPGKDAAGVVESIGEDAARFRPGDRVYTADTLTGTYAEYALCDESQLGLLPENVTLEQGAGVWTPYATAYRALFQKAAAKTGETVLVHGASGGVGIAAVQWAKGAGLTVIGTASSDEGRELVRSAGADHVIDHTDEGQYDRINQLTDGRGVDVIIEMLANVNLENDFKCLAMRGRITIVGNRGSIEFTPRLAMTKDATIYGMSLFNSSQPEREDIHAAIYSGFADGKLAPYVGRRFKLEEAPAAHREVIESRALGKIVLLP